MIRPVFGLTLALAACDDKPTDPTDTGTAVDGDADTDADADSDADTDTTTTDSATDSGTTSTTCPDGFYQGPITIQELSVVCTADQVRFYARTEGWTSMGRVYSQETGNVGLQWSDEHELDSFQFDVCGFEDELEQELNTGALLGNWAMNVSTVFRCDYHFNPPGIMTYAFQVDDIDGNFADCVVAGDDPSGLVNGTHSAVNEPSFNLSTCVLGVLTQ